MKNLTHKSKRIIANIALTHGILTFIVPIPIIFLSNNQSRNTDCVHRLVNNKVIWTELEIDKLQ